MANSETMLKSGMGCIGINKMTCSSLLQVPQSLKLGSVYNCNCNCRQDNVAMNTEIEKVDKNRLSKCHIQTFLENFQYLSLIIFSLYDLSISIDSSVTEWLRLTIIWKSADLDFLQGGLDFVEDDEDALDSTASDFILNYLVVFRVLSVKKGKAEC